MEQIIVLFLIFLIVLSQVLLLVYYLRSKKQNEVKTYDDNQLDLVHDAIKKSQAIIGNAELEAVKQVADSRFETEKLEKAYQTEMKMSVDEVLDTIKAETARAGREYKETLQKQTEYIRNLSSEETKRVIDEFRGQLEKNLHEIQDGFAKELSSYKAQKEKIIDNNAEEIIERAVELYLGKKLDKKEQMQLVFEALEKAKAGKAL